MRAPGNAPGRIMGHCHLFPRGLAEAATDRAAKPGTAEHLRLFIKACGFDRALAISPVEDPEDTAVKARIDGADGVEWLLCQPHVGTGTENPLIPAAAIVPSRSDALEKLRRARAAGVRVLKFHPIIMRSDPLEERSRAFWREAEKSRMPLTYHTGGGAWGWHDRDAHPAVAARLASRHEGLPIMMAHCGVFGRTDLFEEAVKEASARPNLYLDTTAALGRVGVDRWHKALDRVGVGKVIYGNDYPWVTRESVEEDLEFLGGLGLGAAEKEKILGGNLRALLAASCGS